MKKLLLYSSLIIALLLTGCNNTKVNNNEENLNSENNVNQSQNQGSNQGQNQSQKETEEDEGPIVVYDTPNFSEKAGYKVNLDSSLEGVKYDSIFLMDNSTSQLDLVFPDNSIGTMLIESNQFGRMHYEDPSDTFTVDDINISVYVALDGIRSYQWEKDGYIYTFATHNDMKNTQTLSNLVKGMSAEETSKGNDILGNENASNEKDISNKENISNEGNIFNVGNILNGEGSESEKTAQEKLLQEKANELKEKLKLN